MKYCVHCGKQISEAADYCLNCGCAVNDKFTLIVDRETQIAIYNPAMDIEIRSKKVFSRASLEQGQILSVRLPLDEYTLTVSHKNKKTVRIFLLDRDIVFRVGWDRSTGDICVWIVSK